MPINADDMLKVAEDLSESDDEATIRTSIGRSYYSAYHHGLEYFEITDNQSLIGGNGGVHQKFIEYMAGNGHVAASYMLTGLKAKRHLADYKLSAPLTKEDAKASVIDVKRFLEKLK